jgi:hypothetical protein
LLLFSVNGDTRHTMAVQLAAAALPAQIGDDPDEAFEYVLEHVIGLDTQAKRDCILINGMDALEDIT